MLIILLLNAIVVSSLVSVAAKRFERALPLAAFYIVLFPAESQIPIPHLFDLTTERVVIITLIVLSLSARKSPIMSRALPLRRGMIAMAVWWGLSVATSIVPEISLKALFGLIIDYFVVYYVFAKHITSTTTIRKIGLAIVAGMAVCCLFGVLEVYGHWTVLSLFPAMQHRFGVSGGLYVDKARGIRMQSTFGHPILFGSAIAMALPLAFYLASTAKRLFEKQIVWLSILLMFGCSYKASSRGPWLALAISLTVLLFCGNRLMQRYLVAIAFAIVLVLVVRPGIWQTLYNTYIYTVDDRSYIGGSYEYRYRLYHFVTSELDRDPLRSLLGFGPDSFNSLDVPKYASCDSSIAELLLETGYVGLTIALLVLGGALYKMLQCYRSLRKPHNTLSAVFFTNIAAYCFMMTNVAIFRWGQQTVMLWIIVAIGMAYPRVVRHELLLSENTGDANSDTPALRQDTISLEPVGLPF